ncbi:hypothetical protein BGX33_005701 [Mortierella sp. NVP41]|nr:hypothetical protein BGX33_005701 [Mortierella sp. NVP41]
MTGHAASIPHLIPRSCHRLQSLSIRGHSMGTGGFEEGEWMCRDLKELQLDVRELSDKSEIDACLMRLQVLRNYRFRQDAIQEDAEGTTIADRFIRQLLPMDRLKAVCLRTRDYFLASL